MKEKYDTGKYTLQNLGDMYGVSASVVYSWLKKCGCTFTRKRRKPVTEDERLRRSVACKGRKLTEDQRKAISIRNSCNYDGLNGYGHTKRHNKGYILAYAPKHPNAHKDGYVMLHTVLIERKIGRYLRSDEVVHHKNHDRQDNRIDNLELMNKREHSSMHMLERHRERRNDLSIK